MADKNSFTKKLDTAWEGAKKVDRWWDPFDVAASAAANTIEFMVPKTPEDLALDMLTLGRGSQIRLGTQLLKIGARKGKKALTDLLINASGKPQLASIAGVVAKPNGIKNGIKNGVKHVSEHSENGGNGGNGTTKSKLDPKKVRQETDLRVSDASTPEGVEKIFKRKGKDGNPIKHPDQHGGMPEKGTHLHHLVQKRVSTPIHRKMLDLQKQGLASAEDVKSLHDLASKYNLESGSGAKALIPMDEVPHTIHHGKSKRGTKPKDMGELGYKPGVEPSGNHLQDLYAEIENATSPDQLRAIYDDFLSTSAKPLRDQAVNLQNGYEKSGGGQISESALDELAEMAKAQREAIADLKLDNLHELHKADPTSLF